MVEASRKEHAMWLLEQFAPGSGVNNIPVVVRVEGRLRWWSLQQAVDVVVRRHEVLRTVFTETGSSLAKRVVPAAASSVEVEVLQTSPDRLVEDLREYVLHPFGLDAPLVRAAHFLCPGGDAFCFVAHHSVFDARSAALFADDFRAAYDELSVDAEPPAELLVERPATTAPPARRSTVDHWRNALAGVDAAGLALRCGAEAPAEPELTGAQVVHQLSPAALAALATLRRDLRATDNIVMLAAFGVLLAAHGAGPDLVVGVPLDARGQAEQDSIGFHINTLPLRFKVGPEVGFGELVRTVRGVFLDAVAHGDTSTEEILEHVERQGAAWRCPLFRHMFNYLPVDRSDDLALGGGPARLVEIDNGRSRVDLEFFVLPSGGSTRIKALYSTEVHDEADVRSMLDRYDALLRSAAEHPEAAVGALPLAAERDRAVLARVSRGVEEAFPDGVLDRVASVVAAGADRVAVREGDRVTTYGALWHTAARLAEELRGAGVAPGHVVGVVGRSSARLAAAVLATWMAGAAFLPLDGDQPAERLLFQLRDSTAQVVLADDAPGFLQDAGVRVVAVPEPTGEASPVPVGTPSPESCAYVMYTSGSTGRPKGVLVAHANIANVVGHFVGELGATGDDAMLWMTSFTFDPSLLELLVPLVTGGEVVVAPAAARVDGDVLREVIQAADPRFVQATPTTWRLVLDRVGDVLAGRTVLSGGETLTPALAEDLVGTGCKLLNVYGPTEATIWCTTARVAAASAHAPVIGRPVANSTVFVVDEHGREQPPGLRGELCVAGANVGIGYLNRPELTADRFREHPVHGRYYRTGDVARWRHDGGLELFGRADRQVKLRGNRIELGEVESVLTEHEAVVAAAVVAVGDLSGDGFLAAFVEVTGEPPTGERLWEHARTKLPDAALPARFEVVESLPVNSSGKVDYPALTASARRATTRAGEPQPTPDPGVADDLVALWRAVLGREDVTGTSNFFANGGHSLLAVRLVHRIAEVTGTRVRLKDVFDAPTPVALARLLRARGARTVQDEARV